MALTLVVGACKDVPTFPGLETEASVAQVEAAMDLATTQTQTVVNDRLTRAGIDTTRTRRPSDTTRARPADPKRPVERPDAGDRARLAVALGGEAIELAERLLKEHGTDPERSRLLDDAKELERKAEAALKEGHDAAAVALAENAGQMALKAVVLPGGVSEEEARMIHDLAANLLEQAKAAVASDPTELKRHLLGIAEELFRSGTEQLKDPRDESRGVVPLWKSAQISSYLIG